MVHTVVAATETARQNEKELIARNRIARIVFSKSRPASLLSLGFQARVFFGWKSTEDQEGRS